MNNGRIWCVVNPTVGLPAFLGSVALISFTVHFAVLNNTTWVADFFKGSSKGMAGVEGASAPVASLKADGATTFVINVMPNTSVEGSQPYVVTVTPSAASAPPGGLALAASQER